MAATNWTAVPTARFLKDSENTYDEKIIRLAQELNSNFILISYTGTSGESVEKWNWKLIPAFVKKCHEKDIRVSFYMKLTNINWKTMFQERPESRDWLMVYPDGSPALYSGFADRFMGCLNKPAWRQHLKDMIKGAIENDPDALFYDNCFIPSPRENAKEEGAAAAWACYCDTCREMFKDYTRETLGWECELPVTPNWDDPVWQAFIAFRDRTMVEAIRLIVGYAHELNPDVVVYPNVCVPWQGGAGAKGSTTKQLAPDADLLLFEKSEPPRIAIVPTGGARRAITSAVDWKYGAALKDTPLWFRLNPPLGIRYTTDEVKVGMAEASAFNGANHHVHSNHLAEEPDKVKAIRRYYDFLEENGRHYINVKQVADVAILASTPTAKWYSRSRVAQGHEIPRSMQGIAQALVELHIPFNVVVDEDLTPDLDYRALVLPNVACMSDEQAEVISRYVEGGGSLVATGVSSLFDERFQTRTDFALSEVFGVHHGQGTEPLTKSQYGSGLSAYLAGSVAEVFWRDGLAETRDLIKDAMAYALRDEWQIKVDAPPATVTNVSEARDGSTTYLHLINFETVKRVEGIDVQVRVPTGESLQRATLLSPELPDGTDMDIREGDGRLAFTVPVLHIYDLVVLEWTQG